MEAILSLMASYLGYQMLENVLWGIFVLIWGMAILAWVLALLGIKKIISK